MGTRKDKLPGGILIPQMFTDDLEPVGVASTSSTYTQAGPRPGQVVADDALTIARLQITGAQGDDMEISTRAAGNPGSGASFSVRKDGEGVNSWRGWDGPQLLSGWIPIDYDAGSVSVRSYAMATIPSTQTVVIIDFDDNADYKAYNVDKNLTVTTGATATAATNWNNPAMVVLPESERIVAFFGNNAYYTDDLGVTFSTWSTNIISDSVTNFDRTRAAIYRGSIILLISDSATAGTVHHYASSDYGSTFELVNTYTGLGLDVDVQATPYGLIVTYIEGTTRPGAPQSRVLSSAWEEIDLQDPIEISATTRNYQTTSVDEAGKVYVFTRSGAEGIIYSSDDRGATWTEWAFGATLQGDSNDRLDQFCSTWAMGRMLVLHRSSATAASVKYMTGMLVLGGWSSVTVGNTAENQPPQIPSNRWGWTGTASATVNGATWIPIELPAASGWTNSGTAPTLVTPGEAKIAPSAAKAQSSLSLVANTQLVACCAQLRLVSGGSSSTQDVAIALRVADGVFDYEIEILFHSTGYEVNDINSAATASVTRDTTTDQFQILVYMDKGTAKVWDRDMGDTVWNVGANLTITDDSATPDAAGIIAWGGNVVATSDSRWRMFNYASSASTATAPEFLKGNSVLGKPWTALPEPIPDMEDSGGKVAYMAMTSGPARVGDTWTVTANYDYGIRNIDPVQSPSPTQTWRSTDTSEQLIVWDMGSDVWIGDSIALYVGNANFRYAYLESWNGSSWDTRATLDLADGFTGLYHTLYGKSVAVNTGSASSPDRFLWDSELAGAWAMLDPAATTTESHRIDIQTAGSWTNETTVHPVMMLTAAPGLAQGTADADAATRVLNLVHSAGFVMYHPTSKIIERYWRVRIPAGTAEEDTPNGESYYEAGVITVNRAQSWGVQSGWGWSDELQPSLDLVVDASGTRHATSRGTPARSLSVTFVDLHSEVEIRAGTDLDYVSGTNGIPLAAHNDVGYLLQGMFRETDSGTIPVVGVEAFPATTGTIVTDPTLYIYGHMTGSGRINNSNGDLGIDATNRVEGITFREIV